MLIIPKCIMINEGILMYTECKMLLGVDRYRFPVEIMEYDFDDTIDILIGNPSCKPKACIEMSVTKETEDTSKYPSISEAVLQQIHYFDSCSVSEKKFTKGSKDMDMLVKAALKWLIQKYPYVEKVSLSDKSYFQERDGSPIVLLPEKMYLTEGHTWYQKHFGAQPSDETMRILKRYQYVYENFHHLLKQLPLSAWYEKELSKTLSDFTFLKNRQLSGSSWYITKETINEYDIPEVIEYFDDEKSVMSGGARIIPRPWHR